MEESPQTLGNELRKAEGQHGNLPVSGERFPTTSGNKSPKAKGQTNEGTSMEAYARPGPHADHPDTPCNPYG